MLLYFTERALSSLGPDLDPGVELLLYWDDWGLWEGVTLFCL